MSGSPRPEANRERYRVAPPSLKADIMSTTGSQFSSLWLTGAQATHKAFHYLDVEHNALHAACSRGVLQRAGAAPSWHEGHLGARSVTRSSRSLHPGPGAQNHYARLSLFQRPSRNGEPLRCSKFKAAAWEFNSHGQEAVISTYPHLCIGIGSRQTPPRLQAASDCVEGVLRTEQ